MNISMGKQKKKFDSFNGKFDHMKHRLEKSMDKVKNRIHKWEKLRHEVHGLKKKSKSKAYHKKEKNHEMHGKHHHRRH